MKGKKLGIAKKDLKGGDDITVIAFDGGGLFSNEINCFESTTISDFMSLSDKRNDIDDNFNVTYLEKDVKEFIKELKEFIEKQKWDDGDIENYWVLDAIDKLAGEDLI